MLVSSVLGIDLRQRVIAAAAGAYFSLALRGDGTVFSWGSDEQGLLGRGSSLMAPYFTGQPGPVCGPDGKTPLTGIVAIAACAAHLG